MNNIDVTYYLQLLFINAGERDSAYGRMGVVEKIGVEEKGRVQVLYQQKGKHATGQRTSGFFRGSPEELPAIEMVVEVSPETSIEGVVAGLMGEPRLSEKRAVTEANLSVKLTSTYKEQLELFQSELEAVCSQQGFGFERVRVRDSVGTYFFNLLVIGDVRPVLYMHSFIQGRAPNRGIAYQNDNLIFL